MDFSKGGLFDPGYSQYLMPFSQNIDAAYNVLLSIKLPKQRKFKFQMLYPQLLKLLEHTVSFYLGCLLWASFISKNFQNQPKNILDNAYFEKSVDEEQMLFDVNYAIKYIEKLKKDCQYYLGKNCNIPDEWGQVLAVYKNFLTMNNFLVNAKTTADIILPNCIKDLSQSELETILKTIEQVVSTGKLKDLFRIKGIIL